MSCPIPAANFLDADISPINIFPDSRVHIPSLSKIDDNCEQTCMRLHIHSLNNYVTLDVHL